MGVAVTYQTLRIRQQPGVQFVQLYRPDARNTINQALVRELSFVLDGLEHEKKIKVVVLEGLPDAFCTGMDFQEYMATDSDKHLQMCNIFELFKKMLHSSKIIVSKVQGRVAAGGIGIVAASDLVIAEDGATFALSELLFGLLPAMVLPFLIRRVGHHKARLLALSTQPIGATEAHTWGLVDAYGTDTDKILRAYLQRWRRLSASAIRRLKDYMNKLNMIDAETQALAVKTISELMADPEIKEGIRLYVEEGVAPWISTIAAP